MNTEFKFYTLPYEQIKRILDNKDLHTIKDVENFIENIKNTSS